MKRLALAAFLSGCGGGGVGLPVLPQLLGPDCASEVVADDRLGVVGQSSFVTAGIDTKCARSLPPKDESVALTVTGPDGRTTDFTTTGLVHSSTIANFVGVTFTPTVQGMWTVTATFSKTGVARATVRAIARSIEPGVVFASPHIPACERFALTPNGTLACLKRVVRDSATVLELTTPRGETIVGHAMVTRGNTLWVLTDGVLERRDDDGLSFAVSHQGPVPPGRRVLALDQDDVWFPESNRLTRAHPEPDGTLSLTSVSLPGASEVIAISVGVGQLVWLQLPNRPIVRHVAPSGQLRDRALGEQSALFGVLGETIWAQTVSGRKRDLAGLGPWHNGIRLGTVRVAGDVGVGGTNETFASFPRALPVSQLRSATVVPRLEAGVVTFDSFDPGAGFEEVDVLSQDHAFARSKDGTSVKVFLRRD